MYRTGLAQAGTAPHHITQCTPCLRHEPSSRAMDRVAPNTRSHRPPSPSSHAPSCQQPCSYQTTHACPCELAACCPGSQACRLPVAQPALCSVPCSSSILQSLTLCIPADILQGPAPAGEHALSSARMCSGCLDMQCDQQAPSRPRLDVVPLEQSTCDMLLSESDMPPGSTHYEQRCPPAATDRAADAETFKDSTV